MTKTKTTNPTKATKKAAKPTKAVPPLDPAELLLEQAKHIVTGARRKAYGTPEDNFGCIAKLWNVYMGRRRYVKGMTVMRNHDASKDILASIAESTKIDATDVAALMVLMKVARLAETPNHADSWRDIAGYAACGARASGADLVAK